MARTAASGRVAATRANSLLYNGNFEVAPSILTAQTSTGVRWIDGTATGSTSKSGYGWATAAVTPSSAAGFDNTVSLSGTYSMKLSTLNSSGVITVGIDKNATPTTSDAFTLVRLTPGATYTLTGWIKTNNAATNSAFIDVREFSSSFSTLATNSTNKLSGTNASFTQVSVTFTANASTVFATVFLRLNVAGAISDAWFDDITLVPASLGRVAASGRIAA